MSRTTVNPDHEPAVRYGSRDGRSGCPGCGQPRPSARAQYCSAAGKQRAYRERQHQRVEPPAGSPRPSAGPSRRAQTIYECSVCEARYLGVQRCPDCQRFCRALGLGGACPHGEEPVLTAELLLP